ncbi:MAG: BamA/TamA family outer membrane protein, partial [Candidatus Omnitrophica bacterium]|nr:BamA/TamA family outer membrane protein [Candidatus Omnitrophota bacterium]
MGLTKVEIFFIIFSVISLLLINFPAYSQFDVNKATDEITPLKPKEKIENELKQIPQKPIEIRPQNEGIVASKEEKVFFVKNITLTGCESFSPKEFSYIVEKYTNKELSLHDLENLSKEIEKEYFKKGIIAAVFLYPQEIKDENVTLHVIEARMGKLEIQEHKYFNKNRINYYWKIPQGDILRYDKIYESLWMINRNPDREVKTTLHKGEKLGIVDISLDAQTNFPIHLLSTFDREGYPITGKSRIGYGIRHNNFLCLDDVLISGYNLGKDFTISYVYHNIPINPYGTFLFYGYSQNKSTPKKEYTEYGIKALGKNTSISLKQDLFKNNQYLGELSLGLDANDKTIWTNTGTYSRERLRIFNLGGDFVSYGYNNVTYISNELSQGVDSFGASIKNNSSREEDIKPTFTKFNFGIQYRKFLPLSLQANLKFKIQLSSHRLPSSERFSLGGINSVRGYPSDDYKADNASQETIELLIPAFFIPSNIRLPYSESSLKNQTKTVIFIDHGWGKKRNPLINDKQSNNLLSMGVGLRFNLFNQFRLRLEWGFPFASNKTLTE